MLNARHSQVQGAAMAEPSEIEELRARIRALESEVSAFSALFFGLTDLLGPAFLEVATEIAERAEADPQRGAEHQKRMTEALRIIEQFRAGSYGKPKPGPIV
ncbi:hypothetical protein [Methylobacterium sp. CM6257]